jgi:spore coat polysaccharide biosynthesis predicted glycosyltransferase SpsG
VINQLKINNHRVFHIRKEKEFDATEYLQYVKQDSLIIFDTDNPKFYSGLLINELRENGIKTACFSISDLHCITTDFLINPNIISETHNYKTAPYTKKLLGPEYFIFREEFRKQGKCQKKMVQRPYKLLLIFGSADVLRLTKYFLTLLNDLKEFICQVNIVVGRLNPDINEIKEITGQVEIDIKLYIDTKEIEKIYKASDLAITSAGASMWEMALYNIYQLVIASSPRELIYTNYLHKLNYIYKLSDCNSLPSPKEMNSILLNIFKKEAFININTQDFCKKVNPEGIYKLRNQLMH